MSEEHEEYYRDLNEKIMREGVRRILEHPLLGASLSWNEKGVSRIEHYGIQEPK